MKHVPNRDKRQTRPKQDAGQSPTGRTISADAISQVLALYDQGLHLQAYEVAQGQAPLEQWEGTAARIMAGRLARRLGGRRLSHRMLLRAWRADRADAHATFCYASCVVELRGPLAAWQFVRRIGELPQAEVEIQADWLIFHGMLLTHLKDFEEAEKWLLRAEGLAPEHAWLWVQRSLAHLLDNRFEQALEAGQHALSLRPWYELGVCTVALVQFLSERKEEACCLLTEASGRLESGQVALDLARAQLDLGQFAEAGRALERVAALWPLAEEDDAAQLNALRCDVAYHCGHLAESARLAKQVGHPAYERLAARLLTPQGEQRRVVLPVGFVRQQDATCFPAALTALTRFWSAPTDHDAIAREVCYKGTTDVQARVWAEDNGWLTREFAVTWQDALHLLDRGVPFIMNMPPSSSAHVLIAMGYDTCRGVLILRDSSTPHPLEMPCEALNAPGTVKAVRALVLLPREKVDLLDGIQLSDSDLYDCLHKVERAILKHDRADAWATYDSMRETATEHPLTLRARMAIALYDDDARTQISCGDQLLLGDSTQTRLQLLKFERMRVTSGHTCRLEYLRVLCLSQPDEARYWLLHAQELGGDARALKHVVRIIRNYVRQNPEEAIGYSLLAEIRWRESRFEEALELCRFAALLSYREEGLARQYFRRLYELNRTQQGLDFLNERVRRLGALSSAPARTLFAAYRHVDRTQEAEDVLASSLERFSEDGETLLFAAQAWDLCGDSDRAKSLLEAARGRVRQVDWLRTAGQVAFCMGDFDDALGHWQKLAEVMPWDAEAHSMVAGFLSRGEGPHAALEYLRRTANRFPHSFDLQRLLLERSDQDDSTTAESTMRKLLELDPLDVEIRCRLAVLLGDARRHDEAMREGKLALEISPWSPGCYCTCARLALMTGEVDAAEQFCLDGVRADVNTIVDLGELVAEIGPALASDKLFSATVERLVSQQNASGAGLFVYRSLARESKDPKDLLDVLRRILDAHPDMWEAWFAVSTQLVDMDRAEEALALAQQATERLPRVPQLWLQRAHVCSRLPDTEGEIEALQQALRINPESEIALAQLADAHARRGDKDKLESVATELVSRAAPVASGAPSFCRPPSDLQSKELSAHLLLNEGEKLFTAAQYQDALRILKTASEEAQRAENLQLQLAAMEFQVRSHSALKDRLAEYATYKRALSLVERDSDASCWPREVAEVVVGLYLGYVECARRIPSALTENLLTATDAVEVLIKGAGLHDQVLRLLHGRSQLLHDLTRYEEALIVSERALELRRQNDALPGCPLECFLARHAMILCALGRFDAQIPYLDARVEVCPGRESFMCRGLGQALIGDRAAAARDLHRAREIDPEYAYPELWIAGLTGDTSPVAEFSKNTNWIANVARFYLGVITEGQLLGEAQSAQTEYERDERLCETYGFVGLRAERDGDSEVARARYRACVGTRARTFYEYAWANARLRQMGASCENMAD